VSVLLVDIGNTRIKWQLRKAGGIVKESALLKDNAAHFSWPQNVQGVLVSSVSTNAELQELMQQLYGGRLHWLATPMREHDAFIHCYPQPERLGVDRWLAMLGARLQNDGRLLVVDAGTALTIDLLDAGNQHRGGYIVPGLDMSRKALFGGTDRVRRFTDDHGDESSIAPGENTLACVSAGTLRQQVALVQSVAAEYPDYQCLITGGDGAVLAEQLDSRYYPNLIFDGMDSLCAGLFTL